MMMNKAGLWISCVGLWILAFLPLVSAAEELYQVELQSFPRHYEFDACIEAVNRATVSSRIAAQVIEINFDVDDKVSQDAIILRFRDTEFKTRLAQAEAALLVERAQYKAAVARQTEATAEAKRITDLFARKQVTRAALDKAQADKAAADANVAVLLAQIQLREAQVEEAKVQLSYTTIRAPYAGVVIQRHIEVGEMASPGQLLMSGVSLENLRATVKVPQRLVETLLSATVVNIQQEDQWVTVGPITLVPQADAASHSFELRIGLNGQTAFYPGEMSKVQFIQGDEALLVVPTSAIVQRSEVAGVYVNTAQGVTLRQVRLGRKIDSWVEVLAGIDVGEQVVLDARRGVTLADESVDD